MRLVVSIFPDSSNAHDSLALAYQVAGDNGHAIAEYEASLVAIEHDPRTAESAREQQRQHATRQLAKLRAMP